MKTNKKILFSILWIIIGSSLISLAFTGKIDEFWNGMGTGLLIVGILQLLRFYRLQKNETYRKRMEIEISDERNHFLRNKAWAYTGYLFVMIASLSTILFKVLGQDLLSMASSFSVCLIMIIYFSSYFVLKRKY